MSHGFVVLMAMIQEELKVGSWDGLGFGLIGLDIVPTLPVLFVPEMIRPWRPA
jgi:hypothetical protein